jgi:hypothetical protein
MNEHVEITWVDACDDSGRWLSRKELRLSLLSTIKEATCKTTGYIVQNDDQFIAVAQNIMQHESEDDDDDGDVARNVFFIPKGMVSKIRHIPAEGSDVT